MIKSEVTKKIIENGKVKAHATVEISGGYLDIKTELLGILNILEEECPQLLVEAMKKQVEGGKHDN